MSKNFATAEIDVNEGPVGNFDPNRPFEAMLLSIGWEKFDSAESLLSERYDWTEVAAVFQAWYH